MSEPEITLGRRLKQIREARGLSMRRVALSTDKRLSITGVYRIETESRTDPKMSTLLALAEVLKMRVIIDPEGVVIEELE